MAQRKACDILQDAWEDVTDKWDAEAKRQYHKKILTPLMEEANAIYLRNEELARYAQSLIGNDQN